MRLSILDIPIDTLTEKEALEKISDLLDKDGRHLIATPNPEFIVEAQKNRLFKKALTEASLSVPDGTGIVWALLLLHGVRVRRITGVDFMKKICEQFKERKIFLLGANEIANEKTKKILEKKYPGIQITGNYTGTPADSLDKMICTMINKSEAEILFVAYGHPKQELWITRNLPHLKTVKIAMGVGGSFDFISGLKKRAPNWMRKCGIEWLFRLIIEPSRYGRIFTATVIFPIKVWQRKLLNIFRLKKSS
jgi:N-acetylglucosaminyldiphosphoundecaprenol N-acetyl-beta-D-mannosaminyltransferase